MDSAIKAICELQKATGAIAKKSIIDKNKGNEHFRMLL